VSEPQRDDLWGIWRQLARRNKWALVTDEVAFLDQVAAECAALAAERSTSQGQRVAIERVYGALLYQGLARRDEAAAGELWLAFVRTAVGHGWSQPDAEELAQEGVARVFEHLHELRSPQSFLSWAFWVFRTVRRDSAEQRGDEQALESDDGGPHAQLADTSDPIGQAEQAAVDQELWALVRACLPSDFEWQVALRILLRGDRPREVAADMELPAYRIRVAKCRALQRLRDDRGLAHWLERQPSQTGMPPAAAGADDDDT
jgi:RNA polymerase sigma factor (sigma-70 family)